MTDKPWLPQFPVDRVLAGRLIAAARPELAGLTPERVGEGWDNDVWRVGAWAFRFPRRPMGVDLIAVEARVLPGLAARLPVAIPAAEQVVPAGPLHPAPYLAHRFLPGTTGDRAALDTAQRTRLAPQLAGFLATLYAVPVAEARAMGVPDDVFRSDPQRRVEQITERLPALAAAGFAREADAIRDAMLAHGMDAIDALPQADRTLCHGDFYARHFLVDERGELCGVIDWGDVCVADPAIDLSIAYAFLPPSARSAFFDGYGPVDARTHAMARLYAMHSATALAVYATDVGDRPLRAEAAVALGHVLDVPGGVSRGRGT